MLIHVIPAVTLYLTVIVPILMTAKVKDGEAVCSYTGYMVGQNDSIIPGSTARESREANSFFMKPAAFS